MGAAAPVRLEWTRNPLETHIPAAAGARLACAAWRAARTTCQQGLHSPARSSRARTRPLVSPHARYSAARAEHGSCGRATHAAHGCAHQRQDARVCPTGKKYNYG